MARTAGVVEGSRSRRPRGPGYVVGLFGRIIVGLVDVWIIATVVILMIAFILRFLGANPNADFAAWIFRATDSAMSPFRGIFKPLTLDGRAVIDTSLLFAMAIYGFIGIVLSALVAWFSDFVSD